MNKEVKEKYFEFKNMLIIEIAVMSLYYFVQVRPDFKHVFQIVKSMVKDRDFVFGFDIDRLFVTIDANLVLQILFFFKI